MASPREVCFSDVDGTLVHYPELMNRLGSIQESTESATGLVFINRETQEVHPILALPPSSTGMQGYISLETLQLVRELRRANVTFVIISGARYSTVIERLPYLPFADAVVVENGGRIFYHDVEQLTPLTEDLSWRHTHTPVIGSAFQTSKPVEEREGALWELYASMKDTTWAVDARSYTTNFRVKAKDGKTPAMLEELLAALPASMDSSFNLGSADIYPATSGKHRAALYLMQHYGATAASSVCVCDDDNDMQMAAAVAHAYLPGVATESVRVAINNDPSRFSVSPTEGVEGTHEALKAILRRCTASKEEPSLASV